MRSVTDDRGYNQGWAPSTSTDIRADRRCDYIVDAMRPGSGETVLEIGCGTGRNAFLLAVKTGKRIIATDICRPFLEEATRQYTRPNLNYEYFDLRDVNAGDDRSFDYVIGDGILHHLYHYLDEALARMRQLLKPNGRIVFLEPNLFNPYCWFIFSHPRLRAWAKLEPGEMAFSKSFIETKLARAAYRNIRVDYRDFLLPGIPPVMIRPSIAAGAILERLPIVRMLSQSLFISADV